MKKKKNRKTIDKELVKRTRKYTINTNRFKYRYEPIKKIVDKKLKERGY